MRLRGYFHVSAQSELFQHRSLEIRVQGNWVTSTPGELEIMHRSSAICLRSHVINQETPFLSPPGPFDYDLV